MSEQNHSGIPLDVIQAGRDLGAVLGFYMKSFEDAKKVASQSGPNADEIFADAMQGAIYRTYLLGVEDGMKRRAK